METKRLLHAFASGISIKRNNIPKLIDYANEKLKDVNFNESYYEVDFIVNANSPNLKNLIFDIDSGKQYWGQGNSEPIIICENIPLYFENCSLIGANKDTIKFSFNGIDYIKFKDKDLIDKLKQYKGKINITLAGTANINHWGGYDKPQIFIKEIEVKEENLNDF